MLQIIWRALSPAKDLYPDQDHLLHICCRCQAVKPTAPFTRNLDGIQLGSFLAFAAMPIVSSTHSRRSTQAHRLPKRLLSRALMAAALMGGASLLSAGAAQAAWDPTLPNGYECFFGGPGAQCEKGDPTPTPVPIPDGDKILTLLDWSDSLTRNTGSNVQFTKQSNGWHVDLDFANDLVAAASGFLEYRMDITDPGAFFEKAFLSTNEGTGGNYTVTKEFFTDATFSTEITAWQLTNPASPDSGYIGGKTIYVRDSWEIPSDSVASIDDIQNVYTQTVPGPLPVLGAGVAFGFSRRLRRRIQGNRVKA
jgi:hypothetical protein